MLNLNEKLSEVQLLRLRATFHALPLFCLQTQILCTYARTNYATLEINPKPATPNSCKVRAKWIQVCCRNRQRNLNTNNQTSCSRNTRRRWRNSVWKFQQVKLCLFDLNLSMKSVKSFFVYKCKLGLALLYLALFSWLVQISLWLNLLAFFTKWF